MKAISTRFEEAFVLEFEVTRDHRGGFSRLWCQDEMASLGLSVKIAQINSSVSYQRGTIRGLHYQRQPYEECKVMRCVSGAIYNVIVDVRQHSASYRQWFGVELSGDNKRMLYVPPGFANGFLTLQENSEVIYTASSPYAPQYEGGVRWNDPGVKISWPTSPTVISDKDQQWPDLPL